MKFKLYEKYLKESDSPVLDDLIDLGLTKEQAIKAIKYFAPRLASGELGNESKEEEECDIEDIEEITLLSVEEAKRLPKDILSTGEWWWLCTPGGASNYVAIVRADGSVHDYGFPVFDYNAYVRPVLRISNLQSLDVKMYDTILFLGREWIVIDKDLVLLNGDLGERRFDADSNDYETSEIKQSLERWLNKQKKEFSQYN